MNNYRQNCYRSSGSVSPMQNAQVSGSCVSNTPAMASVNCGCSQGNSAPVNNCGCTDNVINGGYGSSGVAGATDCEEKIDMLGYPLAMAYVPWQSWCNLYSTDQALYKGTLFEDLDLDFMGRRCN